MPTTIVSIVPTTMSKMDDEVTINSPNHHQNLAVGLWNNFLTCRGVDYDVQCGAGRSIRAHHLILDLFLSPEKLKQSAQHHQQHGGPIECLLEFLYSGEVTVRREHLRTLLRVARESDFKMLVDVLESRFQNYFAENPIENAESKHETRQNVVLSEAEAYFIGASNEELTDSGNSSESPGPWMRDEAAETIDLKPETTDIAPTPIDEQDPPHLLDMTEVHEDQLDGNGNEQPDSPPNLIDPEREISCGKQNSETPSNPVLPCSIVSPNEKLSGPANVKVDKNSPTFNRELEKPLLAVREVGNHDAPSVEPRKTGVVLPTTSSSLVACPAPETPKRVSLRAKKKKVYSDDEAEVTKPARRTTKNGKLADPVTPEGMNLDVPSEEPRKMGALNKKARLTTSPSSAGSPSPKQPQRFNLRKRKMKKQLNRDADVTKPTRRNLKNGKAVGLHSCTKCGKTLVSNSLLKLHMRRHITEGPFSCYICKRTFSQEEKLKRHRMEHTDERPFECQKCPRRYVNRKSLLRHQRHDCPGGPQSNQCKEADCLATFVRHKDLRIHRMKDHPNLPPDLQCPLCERVFCFQKALNNHDCVHDGTQEVVKPPTQLNETGEPLFSCPTCLKSFLSANSLRKHQRLHGSEGKTYACDTCPKVFYSVHHLEAHSRIHSGIKPFQCPQCDKTYSQKGNLHAHLIVHTDERPFLCDQDQCGKTFRRNAHLEYHKLTHSGIRAFKCIHPKCKKEFYTQGELVQHSRHHGDDRPFVCDYCGKTFFTPGDRNRHERKAHATEISE